MTSRPELVTYVLETVRHRAGLVFPEGRLAGAINVITAWLDRLGIRYPNEVHQDEPLESLLEALVIHESYFDRDLEQLRFVDEVILTDLADRYDQLRVWSAGCASGEEPYSLAFMLSTRGLLDRTSVFATDLSRAALIRARAGRYRGWAVRTGHTPALQYLQQSEHDLCVPERIKSAVRFARLNLVEDPFPTDQHLIVCRNVLIYLERAAIAGVATKLATALAAGGWLIVAPSDPRLDGLAPLECTVTDRGVHYRRRQAGQPSVSAFRHPPAPAPLRTPAPFEAIETIATPLPRKQPAATAAVPQPPVQRPADRVRALADRGDYVAAIRVLELAQQDFPLDAELYFLLAVLRADDHQKESIQALERASYLAPNAPLPYMFAARLHQMRGERDKARRAYRTAVKLLDALPGDTRIEWSDETARILAAACREALEHTHGP